MTSFKILKDKKAAMFGLDARIALAIFGALSVITGAALYSAIQQSKVVSIVAQTEELVKAYEAYLLDTGVNIRKYSDVDNTYFNKGYQLHQQDLTNDSGVKGWQGPYISMENKSRDVGSGNTAINLESQGNYFSFVRIKNDNFGSLEGGVVCTNEKCPVYVQVATTSGALATSIDKYIDRSISANSGRVRYMTSGSSNPNSFFIKTSLIY